MGFVSITNEKYAKEQELNKLTYEFPEDQKEVFGRVLRDYTHAYHLKNKPLSEFNEVSVMERQDEDQRTYNTYIPPKDDSEDMYWRAQTKKPIVRNKVIAIAARITASILAPHVFARNEDNEEDKNAAKIMELLMTYANSVSGYEYCFLNAVIAMLVNPVGIVMTEYSDKYENGFKDFNVPLDEILIANNYVNDIQCQPFVIRDRNIDYADAEAKYGHLENWKYVKKGVRTAYDIDNDQFYEEHDPELESRLVNETIYWNKRENIQLVYIGGIPMFEADNKMDRKSKKYPFVWGGYELIDEGQFAYFKSLVFKLEPEDKMLNELYNMALDGTLLSIFPATALYGEEEIDSTVVAPGVTHTFSDPNARMEQFYPKGDINAGWNAIGQLEASMAEGSQSTATAEGLPNRTAFEVATIEENARVQLGLFGKMLVKFVREWGELKLEDIVTQMPVANVMKLDSGQDMLAYKSVLVQMPEGEKNVKIEFRSDMPEKPFDKDTELQMQMDLLERSKKSGQTIYQVNPKFFRDLKYTVQVSVDQLFKPTGGILRAFNLEGYQAMANNPLIANDPESFANVTRDLLVAQYKPNAVDKYMPGPGELERQLEQEEQKKVQQAQQPPERLEGTEVGDILSAKDGVKGVEKQLMT
jgi:hypothetical protein